MNTSTHLWYLEDGRRLEGVAEVLEIRNSESAMEIVLDGTPFYPRGGGQPADTGSMVSSDGRVTVLDARFHDGIVLHRAVVAAGEIRPGDRVIASVDAATRLNHSRLHTAGELLCAAVRILGYHHWSVVGAIHGVHRASVEYNTGLPEPERVDFASALEATVNGLVEVGGPVVIQTTSDIRVVERLCGFVPDYLAPGIPVRVVKVAGDRGRPCMGTHICDIHEVGRFQVRKIKVAKGRTIIAYVLDEWLGSPEATVAPKAAL